MNLRRKIVILSSIILITAIIAFVAYNFTNSSEIIVIYPEQTETKIKPKAKEDKKYLESKLGHKIPISTSKSHTNSKNTEDEELINTDFLFEARQSLLDPIGKIINEIDSLALDEQNIEDIKLRDSNLNIQMIEKRKFDGNLNLEETSNYKYILCLGMIKTESEVKEIAAQVKNQYPKIFNDLQIKIKKIKQNDKYYYMLIAEGYNSFNKAKAVCRELISNKQSCSLILK